MLPITPVVLRLGGRVLNGVLLTHEPSGVRGVIVTATNRKSFLHPPLNSKLARMHKESIQY